MITIPFPSIVLLVCIVGFCLLFDESVLILCMLQVIFIPGPKVSILTIKLREDAFLIVRKSWCLMSIGVSISTHYTIYVCFLFDSICICRTKAEPAIYYMPAKPIVDDPVIVEQNKEKVFSYKLVLKNFMIRGIKNKQTAWSAHVWRMICLYSCPFISIQRTWKLKHLSYARNENGSNRFNIVFCCCAVRVF